MPCYQTPRRGEVWLADLDPAIGHEIQKTRPVVIVTSDTHNGHNWVVVGVPVTTSDVARYDRVLIRPPEGGLKNASVTQPDQIRAIDRSRLVKRMGQLGAVTMLDISESLKIVMDLA